MSRTEASEEVQVFGKIGEKTRKAFRKIKGKRAHELLRTIPFFQLLNTRAFIEVSSLISNLIINKCILIEKGYDLVIRIGAPEKSGLVAKRLCDLSSHICANKDFLNQHGNL